MVIAFIELARADHTLHTSQGTQDSDENIILLHMLRSVQSYYICIFTCSAVYLGVKGNIQPFCVYISLQNLVSFKYCMYAGNS